MPRSSDPHCSCLFFLFFIVVWAEAVLSAADVEFAVVPDRRQLFLDDDGIAQRQGLPRRFHAPDQRGAVVRSPDAKKTIQTRTAPVWDEAARRCLLWVITIDQSLCG